MGWEVVDGGLIINWFPSALLFTVAMVGALLIMRRRSLGILLAAPDFHDRRRYIRGARWGWLLALASFIAVVAAMIVLFDYTQWDLRAAVIAWVAALFPVAGSAGLLMLEEFMGFCVGAQAAWDALGGRRIDLMAYRAETSRTIASGARWVYYAAWVVGSAGLTAGPLMLCIETAG